MLLHVHCVRYAHRVAPLLMAVAFWFACASASAQAVLDLINREDLTLDEIEVLANRYFDSAGTGQGTGYKQFQRWLYEARFHQSANGKLRSVQEEWMAYKSAVGKMSISPSSPETHPWKETGPFSWNRTSGWNPGVGRITAIAVHPLDTTLIYVTSPGGGLWKSTTGGNNWVPLTDDNATWMNLYSVAVDPANTQVVYAGNASGGVMKSTNGGSSFTTISGGSGIGGVVWKIFIQPGNSNHVFVCSSSGGIHRSTNGGSTWTRVLSVGKEDIECKPGDPNILYATGTSLHRSADNGLTWTFVGAAEGLPNSGRMLVSVSPQNPDRVYLVQASGSNFGWFYRSDNAGLNFTVTVVGNPSLGTNYFGYTSDGRGTTGQATYDMAMCANPANADEVHIAGIICWKSTNAGTSFTATTEWYLPNGRGYNHADVHVLEWVGKTIYSGTDGGIYKSAQNGSNWIELSIGLGIRQFYRMAGSVTSSRVFAGGAQDNGTSVRRATGWVDWLGADGMDCIISPLDSNLMVGTSQNGSIYRTTNGGSSYVNLPKPTGGNWVTPLAIALQNGKEIMFGGWRGVYKSENNGTSWTLISDITNQMTANVVALAVAPSNPQYLYASIGSRLFATSNQGQSWIEYAAPASINAIAVSPANPQKVYLACNTGGAFRACVSTNAGQHFTDISNGLPGIVARSVAVDSDAEESIYYGMNIGVFFKNNHTPWTDLSANLPKVAVNEVEIQPNARMLRVATYGRGIWQRNLAGGFCTGGVFSFPAGLSGASYQWQVNTGAGYVNLTNGEGFSGAQTSTLSVGVSAHMKGFRLRCAVTSAGTTTNGPEYNLRLTNYWTGNANSDWNNPLNWSCGSVPGPETDVVVSGEKQRYPVVLQTINIHSLEVANGARVTVQPGHQILLTAKPQ